MKDTMIGVDLAKRVFQLHGASMTGHVKFRKKLTREQFWRFMSEQPACIVVFEACGSASYWARKWKRSAMTSNSSRRSPNRLYEQQRLSAKLFDAAPPMGRADETLSRFARLVRSKAGRKAGCLTGSGCAVRCRGKRNPRRQPVANPEEFNNQLHAL